MIIESTRQSCAAAIFVRLFTCSDVTLVCLMLIFAMPDLHMTYSKVSDLTLFSWTATTFVRSYCITVTINGAARLALKFNVIYELGAM